MIDLSHLKWDNFKQNSPVSDGTLPKCQDGDMYYKLSSGDDYSGFYGHESLNECIVSDILDGLNIPHVKYSGSMAKVTVWDKPYETFACWSKEFKKPDERSQSFEKFYQSECLKGEDTFDFCKRLGFEEYALLCFVVDYLIINRDRHGANIEVLTCNEGVRLTPLFDHGLSLIAPLTNRDSDIGMFDAMLPREVNNFIGSKFLEVNLQNIQSPIMVNPISVVDTVWPYKEFMSSNRFFKTIEILDRRYNYLLEEGYICEKV